MDLQLTQESICRTVRLRSFSGPFHKSTFVNRRSYKISYLRKHIMRERENHSKPNKVDVNGSMV